MRTPRDLVERAALWRIDPAELVRPDEETTVRRIELARGAWGLLMLAGPPPLLRGLSIDDDQAMIATVRVLGLRHVVQASLSGARPSPEVLAMGIWVDAVHALCALALATSSPHRAAAGVFDAVVATGWAVAGYRDLVNPGASLPTHTGRRDALARRVLRVLPGGSRLADRVEQDRARLPAAQRGGSDDRPA